MQNKREITRRRFLEFMGKGALALSIAGSGAGAFLQACSSAPVKEGGVETIGPSAEDKLRLARGLRYQIVAGWGDELKSDGTRFGFNNDFLAYFPLEGKRDEALLCVNHETPNPVFVSGYSDLSVMKTKAQVEQEMDCTGMSVVHIRRDAAGAWRPVKDSSYNRLVNGKTKIPFAGGRPIEGATEAVGTLGNCAGGKTPWGTYLTCEENFDQFYGDTLYRPNGKRVHITKEPEFAREIFGWYKHFPYPPEHYGWVVEVDPRTGHAVKHVALGRFAHESATVTRAKDGRVVVYSGDDTKNEHFYKFVSDSAHDLKQGTLYVANTEEGRWLPLKRSANPKLRKKFKDQTELLIRTREAARIVGATPLDRPEDVEIDPATSAVYVSLTNNVERGNYFGSIMKLEETGGDHGALTFRASTFLSGGAEAGLACPDNLAFDPRGNLWITTDVSGKEMHQPPYTEFKNNGLFFVAMSGPEAGLPKLVATAPRDAEFTGPEFSPDGRTLFLSVQHPGEQSLSVNELTSHWPEGGNSVPRPAVVAISGELLATLSGV
jgi:uncharacterized protein